jgi:hypothetical protein
MFLYNKKNNLLNISNKLLTFNNIKLILQEAPYFVENNVNINTLTKPFDTLLHYQKALLHIDHVNINISLDIINDNDNIYYNNFMLFFYDQSINLNFKNYSMYNLLEKYKEIIHNIMKKISMNQFSFNVNLLSNISYNVIDILNTKKINTDTASNEEDSKVALIDIYLKDFENTPESKNDLCNYIYFLRKFPMFRKLLNHYLYTNEPEIYSIIEQNKLDINSDMVFLPILFKYTDNEKIIYNVNTLFKQDYSLNDFLINIDTIDINIENLLKVYNNINFYEYGIVDDELINIEVLSNKIYNMEYYDIYTMISLYFKVNNVDILMLNYISLENFNILISMFLINLYIIYDYLNLKEKEISDMLLIYKNSSYNNFDLTELLFYIHLSYYVFHFDANQVYIKIIDSNINLIKHYLYIIQYSKNTLQDMYPLIIFLSCSNKQIKFIYEYKAENNYILEFLNEYYDIVFDNRDKIVIKKTNL